MRALSILFFVFFPCCGLLAQSLATCHHLAENAYEKLFCTLQEKGAQDLPTFESFRANSPRLQAIILKRPAQKYGLKVPAAPTKARSPSSQPTVTKNAAPVDKPPPKTPAPRPPATAKKAAVPARASSSVQECTLHGDDIQCAHGRFRLADNLPNSRLAKTALTATNSFGLAGFTGNKNDAGAVNRYLSASYRHYIEKMLAIGLGGATMSYTKFHYTFEELAQKNEDFAQRFETMYEYLKRDKAALNVKARYHEEFPGSIELCQALSEQLIVCDNASTNWVYVYN